MSFSIGVKLGASFFVIFAIAASAGLYSLFVTEEALREAVGKTSEFLAQEQIGKIDRDIYLKIEDIQLFAQDKAIQQELRRSNEQFLQYDASYIKNLDSQWTEVPADTITPFMQGIISNSLSSKLRDEFMDFWSNKYGKPIYGEVFLTNKYGANIAQTGKTSDYYQADEDWWKLAMDNGFHVGEIEFDISSGAWTMPLGVRVDDSNGNFLGVIKAIPLARDIITNVDLASRKYQSTQLKLFTANGDLIYTSDALRIMPNTPSQEIFSRISTHSAGFFIDKENGEEKLFAFAHSRGFRDFDGLGWIIALGHNTSEVFAPINQLRTTLSGMAMLIVSVFAFVFLYISRSISTPIRRLTRGAGYIAKGNLDVRIKTTSKDEVGQLAIAFNKMTSKLQRSYKNLEQDVEKRTIELQNKVNELDKTAKLLVRRDLELSQANEKLRKMDESKSRFVSIAAHQLRTPISAVKWSISMTLDGDFGKLPKPIRSTLTSANASLDRLIELISRLLNVARIEEGRFPYKFSKLQIEEVCKNVHKESLATAKMKGVHLKLSIPKKSMPALFADSSSLILAIQNLVDNAIKYTPQHGTVEIEATIDPQEKSLARISVRDTGIGIPAHQKSLIGQKFFRGDNVRGSKISGSGLGLYIASQILAKHDANLKIESEENKGSTFYFTIPFLQEK